MKYILICFFLLIGNIAHAETQRQVLLFSADWCHYCKAAKEMIAQKDVTDWILTYEDNAVVDLTDKNDNLEHQIAKALKVDGIPTILIVDVETGDEENYKVAKILFRWQTTNDRDQGKNKLKAGLYQFSPKKQAVRQTVPFFKRIVRWTQ